MQYNISQTQEISLITVRFGTMDFFVNRKQLSSSRGKQIFLQRKTNICFNRYYIYWWDYTFHHHQLKLQKYEKHTNLSVMLSWLLLLFSVGFKNHIFGNPTRKCHMLSEQFWLNHQVLCNILARWINISFIWKIRQIFSLTSYVIHSSLQTVSQVRARGVHYLISWA